MSAAELLASPIAAAAAAAVAATMHHAGRIAHRLERIGRRRIGNRLADLLPVIGPSIKACLSAPRSCR